jgi:hypothetical protein
MNRVPRALLEHIQRVAPPGAEVVPLDWAYEDEDQNIAVFIDDREDIRRTEARLLDVVSDDDEAHGTFTVCMAWHKREKALAGVR